MYVISLPQRTSFRRGALSHDHICTTVFSRNDVLNMSVASCFQHSEAIRTVNVPFSSSLTHVGQLPSLIQIHTQFGSNVVSSLVRSTVEAVRPHVRLSRCRDESWPTDSTSPTAPPLRLQSEAQLLSAILLAIGSSDTTLNPPRDTRDDGIMHFARSILFVN